MAAESPSVEEMDTTPAQAVGVGIAPILQQLGKLLKGRISLQILLFLALVRLYAPVVSILWKFLSKIFPSFMKNRELEEDSEELNAPMKKIYESFVDDRVAQASGGRQNP